MYESVSLVMLAVVTLTLSLPLSVYTVAVCVISPQEVPSLLEHPPGLWLVFVHGSSVLVIPFIYIWRFISWKEIWTKLKNVL